MPKCDICGSNSIHAHRGDREFQYKDHSGEMRPLLVKDIEWLECGDCGESLFDDHAMEAIEAARRKALGLLSREDFVQLRKRVGLTQSGMARLLGCGEKTYCRWESGQYLHSEATDRYVRMLIDNPANIDLLQDICVTKEAGTDDQQIAQLSKLFGSLDWGDPTYLEREARFTSDLVEGKLQTGIAGR